MKDTFVAFMRKLDFHRRNLRRVGAALAASLLAWGCSIAVERIGQSSAPLTVGSVGSNNGETRRHSEIGAAWSPAGRGGAATLVAGYNIGTPSPQGWAWSTDGLTWNSSDTDSLDAGGGRFRGDPTMVADHRGDVVYVMNFVSAANVDAGKDTEQDEVVAMVSTDGGRTFKDDHWLVVDPDHCSGGDTDQPTAAFDQTTDPPTLWVGWRHRVNSSASWGACLRRGTLDPNDDNRIHWTEDSVDLQNFFGEGGHGIGSIRVQAGDGAVTVVYTNTESPPQGCTPTTNLYSFAVEALTSFDDGHTWQTKSRMFHADSTWAQCVLDNKVEVASNFRNADFVRAPDGTDYVIAQYDQWRARLFRSRMQGVGSNGNTDGAWSEWCPNTATADGGPTSNWTAVGVECPEANWTFVRPDPPGKLCADPLHAIGTDNQDSCSIAMPTIAADDRNALAVSYYESDDTNDYFHVRVWTNATPRNPTSSFSAAVIAEPSPPVTLADAGIDSVTDGGDFNPLPKIPDECDADCMGTRALGDYQAMTVQGSLGLPICGDAGTFNPFWTVAFPANTSFVQTAPVTP